MRQKLLLLLSLLISTIAMAQTTWTGGGANTNWNNIDNWDTNQVPTALDDVVIPTGFTVTLNVPGNVKSIDLQGNSTFDINTNFTFNESSTFGTNTIVNWASGSFNGGSTLTNNGTINLTTGANHFITGSTIVNNAGTINLTSTGDLFVSSTGTELNNLVDGTVDIQEDFANITWSGAAGIVNNEGLFKKTTSLGEAQVLVPFFNNDGTIEVEEGTLSFSSAVKTFIDGTYNVFAGAILDWDTTINVLGLLSGTLAGNLNWNSNVTVDVGNTSIFNFTEPDNFSWTGGTLNGGGILSNLGTINITTSTNHFISGETTLDNQGALNMTSIGDLFVSSESILSNPLGGVIDMQEDGGNISFTGVAGIINNSGLIKKTTSGGEAQILTPLNNNGTIQVEEGILSFQSTAKNFTDGTYNVFTGATMDWDVAINVLGTLSGTLDGNINWTNTVIVSDDTTANFEFGGPGGLNWISGALTGGGTLENTSIINTFGTNVFINGFSTLTNNNTINLKGVADIFISTDSALNNTATGIIDFQADNSGISETGAGVNLLNNFGLIKTSFVTADPTDQATIGVELKNNDGTLQVEVGTLNLSNPTQNSIELTDGVYNVFADAALDFDSSITLSGTLTGTLTGDLNWRSNVYVNSPNTATFNFSGNESVSWIAGSLLGGGTLINESTINTLATNVFIIGATTLTNNSNINLIGVADIFIGTDSILNNTATGIIDFQADNSGISETGAGVNLLNNFGLIKTSFVTADPTDQATIGVELKNNDGTLQVEVGTLNLSNPTQNSIELTDGVYNVFADAALDFDSSITLSGTLTGTLTGDLNWRSNVYVNSPNTATFNFSGNESVSWIAGSLLGGGTLINESTINTLATNVFIIGATTLTNNSNINLIGVADIFIGTDSILNNTATGIIDFQADNSGISETGAGVNLLNNSGLIVSSSLTTTVFIGCEVTNTGIINAASGTINFTGTLDHQSSGIIKGIANINLPPITNLTNSGTFSPGASPGTLTVIGNYTSTANTVLDIELNGLTPDTEYDVLAITGTSVVFEGTVNVTMGFDAEIGDEFTVATTTGTIATANLQSPIEMVDLDGKRYTFDISYPDDNKVVLTITDKVDILPPNVVTQDITVQLDNTGNVSILPSDIDNGSTDNCSLLNELIFSLDIDSFTCADLGDNIVNLTVTDIEGNSASAPATVTVEDVTVPTVITNDITIQLDGSGSASIVAADVNNGSTDNCGIASLSIDNSTFDCSNVGANTVTLTVTDTSGNMNTGEATVTVEDVTVPTVITQDIIVQLDGSGSASIVAAELDNGSTDNCGIASLSVDISSFDCSDVGANTVTLTVIDTSGNMNTGEATVTVEDSVLPMVVTQDITIQLDGSGSASTLAADIDDGSSDNCGIASLSLDVSDFDCSDVGANTVTLTVTDVNGNSNTGTAIVTVEDNLDPVVVTKDIIVQLDGSGNASITPAMIDDGSTDNCGIAGSSLDITSFTTDDLGPNTVTLTVTDINGNFGSATAIVTVEAGTDLVTAIAKDITVQLDANGEATITAADVDDGSSVVSGTLNLSIDITEFDCSDLGPNTVTLTVSDGNGNFANAIAVVTVEDNILPTVVVQDITVQLDTSGNASITPAMIDNGSTDNCGIASLSVDVTDFDCSDVGANTVTLTVTDINGNFNTGIATVTVEDNVLPTVVTQDITVQLDGSGNASVTPAMVDDGSFDSCGLASLSLDETDFDVTDIGPNTVTLTVTDNNGNSNSATAIVTVEQATDLVNAVTKDITVQLDANGQVSITPEDVDNGSTVESGTPILSLDVSSFDCSNIGANTVTLTVTDTNSNSDSATATVTVEDVTAPTVVTQDITIQLDGFGNASITPAMIDNGSTDNCEIESYSLDVSSFTTSDLGENTVTLTVTDQSSNSDSATAIVTVEENDGPPNTLAFQEVFTGRGLVSGSVAFADVDGDNDQDVVLSGALRISATGISGPLFSDLFKNDGNGNFTQVLGGAPFMGLAYSSVSFRDLNNDNILDVISTGENITTGNNFDNFYTNDGTGRFSQVPGFAFTNLERKDFKFADLDGDSDDDLLIIGEDNNGIPRVKLFESQGSSFSPQSNNLPNVLFGSIAEGDVNGDNLTDIFISGQLTNGTKIAEIYINNGNFQFSLLPATSFEGLDKGDSSFADVDNDGDQDLLISGQNSNMDNILKLYLNDGTGSFTEAVGIINLSSNIFMQAFEFADIDGDSDLDVLMTGYNTVNYRPVTKIWENLLVSPIAPRSDDNTSSNFAVNFIDSNLEFGLGFRVFPNPTDRGYFDIETPGLEGEISITMSDAQGRIVLSQNNFVTDNNVKVYTKDVLGGLYIVTVKKGNESFITKVIVK